MPVRHEQWWRAWRRQYPSYEFITWTDQDIDTLPSVKGKISEAVGFARKSDIARYEILRQHGGIYIDTDIMPVNYFDFGGQNSNVITCGPIDNESINNAFIAISKEHVAMAIAVDLLNKRQLNKQNVCFETGPNFLASLLKHFECKRLPWQAMYPYNHSETFSSIYSADLSRSVGIHVWNGSWYGQDLLLEKIRTLMLHGDMIELEDAASYIKMDEDAAKIIFDIVNHTKNSRIRDIEGERDSISASLEAYGNGPIFDIFKMSIFLFTERPGSVIWNIGAGDGIGRDKMRPTIINYDPPTILIEPNPYLFKRLKENFARNRNTTFLWGAVCPEADSLRMTIINPDKLEALQLPNALSGMSRATEENIFSDCVFRDILTRCSEEIDVPGLSLSAVLDASEGKLPTIVSIDTNSMDAVIINHIISMDIRPLVIATRSCNGNIGAQLQDNLARRGYRTIDNGDSTLFVSTDFIIDYCSYLYINYGMATIFEESRRRARNHNTPS
jgi:hypothetical protein